jgi:hypothetical protein
LFSGSDGRARVGIDDTKARKSSGKTLSTIGVRSIPISHHSTVALEATMPTLTRRVGLRQSCDLGTVLRQRDPEGLPETRWTENRSGVERTARQPGLAYVSSYLSVLARRDGGTHRSPAETDAACAGIDHYGRVWQRADGFQARGQQQGGKPAAQNSKGTAAIEAVKKAPSGQRLRKASTQPLKRPLIVGLCGVGESVNGCGGWI